MEDKQIRIGWHDHIELNDFADVHSINKKIEAYVESILPRINIEELIEEKPGWERTLYISYKCSDVIGVYKKIWRYPADKAYDTGIDIPIPDNTQAPYGLPPVKDGRIGFFHPVADNKNKRILDPEYEKYVNLEQYIIASAIKAIDLGFTKGFTCYGYNKNFAAHGKKIKFQDIKMKDEQVEIGIGLEVVGLHNFADVFSIDEKITTYAESILPRINIEDLSGWRLSFHITYRCTDFIGVDKKFLRHPSDREYVISIAIPIPDNTQASYGMPPAKDGTIGCFHPGESRRSHLLDPEYDQYDNLDQYIIASTIKAIDLGFSKGFTCCGKKIKFQDL